MRRFFFIFMFLLSWVITEAQVYENPVFDRTDVPSLHIDKIEMTKTATVIHCTYIAVAGSWANISRDVYLQDEKTKKKYSLVKCDGFPFDPEKKTFLFAESYEVSFYFSPTKFQGKVDFIEDPNDQAFNIYGIDISNHYSKQYRESDIKRFSDMASFYESSGDIHKAIQNKEEEIKATQYVHGVKSDAFLVSLFSLAILHDKYEMYGVAVQEMDTLTKLQAELWGTNDRQYAQQLRTHGQFYSHAGMREQAIQKYKESIALYEKLNVVDDQYILALSFLSDEYQSVNKEDLAIDCRLKSIIARKSLGNSDNYLYELETMLISGRSNDRILVVENELKNLPSFVDTISIAYTNMLKAMIVAYDIIREDFEKALYYCDRSLSILKVNESENILRIADILGRKCRYLLWLNMYKESIETGENAKNIFDSHNIKPDIYITILQDLASCYFEFYDYEKSDSYLKQMEDICEERKDWLSLAEAYKSIGFNYKYLEQLDKAEQCLMKAIEILNNHDDAQQYIVDAIEQTGNRSIDNPSMLAAIKFRIDIDKCGCYGELARIYQKQGKISDAIEKEIGNEVILKEIGDEQMYARHLEPLAEYYIEDKQYENAKDIIEQIIQLDKDNKYKILPMSYALLAKILKETGKLNEAILNLEKAAQLSKLSNNFNEYFSFYAILSGLYCDKGLYNKAEEKLSEVLELVQNAVMADIVGMKSNQKQRLWDKYELYFVKYRDIIEKSNKSDSLLSKLYNYLLFSKSLLLESEMYNNPARIPVNWRDIQQHLKANDIAVEFFFTQADSVSGGFRALIIDKKCKAPRLINLFSYSDYEELMATTTKGALNTVGNLVWKEILKQYSPNNIYFSPDGFLHMVPIEYSNVDGIGEMTDHYNIFRLSSTKELLFHNQLKNYNKAILYGGLDYETPSEECIATETNKKSLLRGIKERGGFEPLPNTYEEIKDIANILNNQTITTALYSGTNGTEDSFKKLSGGDANIMHLSTHGMYVKPDKLVQNKEENNFDFLKQILNEKDPVKEDIMLTHSFLVMAGGNELIRRETNAPEFNDGILTASEISQLDFHNLDLVVLSACETGLGQLDFGGVFGLQRGFKKAGAKTILMSLDKVDDEATKILMVEFYRNLMDGKTKHQSLKDAQRYLRQVDNGKYDKPEYWASFIMLDGIY